MKALPSSARYLIAIVHVLALGTVVCAVSWHAPPLSAPTWEIGLYALLAIVAGGRKVRVTGHEREEEVGSFSLGFAIIFATILRAGPLVGSGVALLSCLSSCLYPHRQALHQLVFNLSLTAIQSWTAGLVYFYLNGRSPGGISYSLAAGAVTGLIYLGINSAGVMGIIGLCRGESPLQLWKATILEAAPVHLAVAMVIALTVSISGGQAGAVLLFGAPVAFLLHYSYVTAQRLAIERQEKIEALQTSEARLEELYEQSEARARQQKALTHLGMLALSEVSAGDWLEQAASIVGRTMDAEYVVMLEKATAGADLRVRATFGLPAEIVGEAWPGGVDSIAGYTLLGRAPVVVSDIARDTRFSGGPMFRAHGAVSGLTAPVYRASGEIWGVLGVYAKSVRTFSEESVAFTQGVANLTALMLDRWRHIELVEANSSEIEALNARLQRAMAETHHRVKNNLQIVSGLIDIQMDEREGATIDDLKRLGAHVRGLAAIHDLLTQHAKGQGDSDYLSTREVLDRLIPLVRDTTGTRRLEYRVDDAMLPVGKGASLAVLLNELVSNAVKHGSGDIRLSLAVSGGEGRLEVNDDGPGFPDGFDSLAAANTGLELVESLTRLDLQGVPAYETRPEGGGRVTVTFPVAVVDARRRNPLPGERHGRDTKLPVGSDYCIHRGDRGLADGGIDNTHDSLATP